MARFSTPNQPSPGAKKASLYSVYQVSFPGVKWQGLGVDHPTPFSTKVKKEYSYTSTLPLDLNGLLIGEFYFTLLYFNITDNGN